MKITECKINLFPAKCSDQIFEFDLLHEASIAIKQNIPKLSMIGPFDLDCVAKNVLRSHNKILHLMFPFDAKSISKVPFLSQKNSSLHMIFRAKIVCLNLTFLGDDECCLPWVVVLILAKRRLPKSHRQ